MSSDLIGTYEVKPYNYIKVTKEGVECLTIEKQVFKFSYDGIENIRSFIDHYTLLDDTQQVEGEETGAITMVSENKWTGITTPEDGKLTLIFELNKLSNDSQCYRFTGTGFNPDKNFSTSFETIIYPL